MSVSFQTNKEFPQILLFLERSQQSLAQSFERLSSGLRINKASDDPAGLALAASLGTEKRVYSQAVRNVNDAVSMLTIAEGAVQELTNIVIRERELATQAASGTLTLEQRRALHAEAQALTDEFNRIVQATEFNSVNVLSDLNARWGAQAGIGSDAYIPLAFAETAARPVGDGTFQAAVNLAVGVNPQWLSTADLNMDGKADLIAANGTADSVSIMLGNGDGTFQAELEIAAGDGPSAVEAGDVNGDGVPDLLVSNLTTSAYSVLIGNGDGTFKPVTTTALPGGDPRGIALGDFNKDGRLDAVISNRTTGNTVSVLLGRGDGTFAPAVSYAGGNGMMTIKVGDMNNDGFEDVITADREGSSVNVLLGNGNGGFQTPMTFATADGADNIAIDDFNRDGVLDVAAGGTLAVSILYGNGDGSLGSRRDISVGTDIGGVVSCDVNADGYRDLAVTDWAGGYVTYFSGSRDGTFTSAGTTAVGANPYTIAAADFNNDGADDLATVNQLSNDVSVLAAKTKLETSLPQINLALREGALQAISELDQHLERLGQAAGTIGALQSRLYSAAETVLKASENTAAAESRIIDIDVAEETAKLVRNQILQEAGIAVLGQANANASFILQLLVQ